MKNLRISTKLLVGVALQVIVMGMLIASILVIGKELNGITSDIENKTSKSEAAETMALAIKDYFNGNLPYDAMLKQVKQGGSWERTDSIDYVYQYLEEIHKLKTNNDLIEAGFMEVSDNSIQISNDFVKIMSAKLANKDEQHEVDSLARLVLYGAITNTHSNHIIKELFLEMKTDAGVKDELKATMDGIKANALQDLERMKNTPFEGMVSDALMQNATSQKLFADYLENERKADEYITQVFAITNYLHETLNLESMESLSAGFIQIKKIYNTSLFVIVLFLLVVILLNSTTSRLINLVFKQLSIDITKISNGDLAFSAPEAFLIRKDEFGDIARAINNLLVKLKDIIGNIRQGSSNIASASIQISTSSQQLSQGANEQASSVEEISSTMEEISSNIEQNTENSKSTESISKKAEEGISIVSETAARALEATRDIAQKIEIITDIAAQTNILALNAAVEAARAGEHGKGFAVVASEVRKLAERSRDAAEDIVKLAKHSYTLAEESGKKMNETLPEVNKTYNLVQEISAASVEQSNGVSQVNSAIQQLNNVTQQNASSSEELASSSEVLASQAESLKELVSYFVINDESQKLTRGKDWHPDSERNQGKAVKLKAVSESE